MKSDRLWLLLLLTAAVILYTSNLGESPLRDWDEGTVAMVARNIWRGNESNDAWLYPTIGYDRPYWNKPPLVHWSIAICYQLFGISEWSSRIFPALLSAVSVPVVYKIAREIFKPLTPAIFSAVVYLTLMPIVRHGRLAMLDGAIALWYTLAIWCFLKARYRWQYTIGAGIALGLICLTKGIMMGVLLGGIAIAFLLWDAPKLLRSFYFWVALSLGVVPAIAWYGMQYLHYGEAFLGINLGKQTFNRIWQPVSNSSYPPWYYLLEIVKYTFPWLLFLPGGIKLAIQNKNSSWAKLALVWGGIYLLAISSMVTKLPWYIMPIYPALALLIGAELHEIWQKSSLNDFLWLKLSLSFFVPICYLSSIYYGWLAPAIEKDLQLVFIVLGLGLTIAAVLAWRNSRYFIVALAGGLYFALLLFFHSDNWIWELAENYPVKPIAERISQYVPPKQIIYTSDTIRRPSLEFYSDRVILPKPKEKLQKLWQEEKSVYFLLDRKAIAHLDLKKVKILGDSVTWQLITRND